MRRWDAIALCVAVLLSGCGGFERSLDAGCSRLAVKETSTTSAGILSIELDNGVRYRGKANLKTYESDGSGGFHLRRFAAGETVMLCTGPRHGTFWIEHDTVGAVDGAIVRRL